MMRAVIGWKSVLYESIEHRAELKLSYYVRPFPGLHFSFFSDNWKWNFGTEASRQVATEEPNKGL